MSVDPAPSRKTCILPTHFWWGGTVAGTGTRTLSGHEGQAALRGTWNEVSTERPPSLKGICCMGCVSHGLSAFDAWRTGWGHTVRAYGEGDPLTPGARPKAFRDFCSNTGVCARKMHRVHFLKASGP